MGKTTGIGRFLKGLLHALIESDLDLELMLAISDKHAVPYELCNKKKTKIRELRTNFLSSEKVLSDLARQGVSLFLSPYPKLPLFGSHCLAANTIHDVLDLTHPAYKKRFKTFLDTFRLRLALKKASLTWFDSTWSLKETEKCAGFVGKNPKVRYLAIDERFKEYAMKDEDAVLKKYQLTGEYIIVIGNGLPHKNLGVLLAIADVIARQFVFVGVSEKNQRYWRLKYQSSTPRWISHVDDEELPALIRGAYCLAQPSMVEGYGYPPLEAMACGIPAVVSNIQVLRETTGGHALFADPSDSKPWLQAFETLERRGLYKSQAEKGLKWVEPLRGRKGWEKHVSDIEELLKGG